MSATTKDLQVSNIDPVNALETKIFDIFLEVTIKLRYKSTVFRDSTQVRSNLANNNSKIYTQGCCAVSYQQF